MPTEQEKAAAELRTRVEAEIAERQQTLDAMELVAQLGWEHVRLFSQQSDGKFCRVCGWPRWDAPVYRAEPLPMAGTVMAKETVKALLGGEWPDSGDCPGYCSGFCWDLVDYWELLDGELVPMSGDGESLNGPNLQLKMVPSPFAQAVEDGARVTEYLQGDKGAI